MNQKVSLKRRKISYEDETISDLEDLIDDIEDTYEAKPDINKTTILLPITNVHIKKEKQQSIMLKHNYKIKIHRLEKIKREKLKKIEFEFQNRITKIELERKSGIFDLKLNYYLPSLNQFKYMNGSSACGCISLYATYIFSFQIGFIKDFDFNSILLNGIEIWKKWYNYKIRKSSFHSTFEILEFLKETNTFSEVTEGLKINEQFGGNINDTIANEANKHVETDNNKFIIIENESRSKSKNIFTLNDIFIEIKKKDDDSSMIFIIGCYTISIYYQKSNKEFPFFIFDSHGLDEIKEIDKNYSILLEFENEEQAIYYLKSRYVNTNGIFECLLMQSII